MLEKKLGVTVVFLGKNETFADRQTRFKGHRRFNFAVKGAGDSTKLRRDAEDKPLPCQGRRPHASIPNLPSPLFANLWTARGIIVIQ